MYSKTDGIMFPNHFIQAGERFTTIEDPVPAPYFRKTVTLEQATKGELLITACGFYELYINGNRITKGYMAPYISNPNDIVYYDRYSVELESGKNVIGVLLGNGFQNNPGGYVWKFDEADFRGAPKLALSLTYKDANGEEAVIVSDETFKTAPSPILFDDYRFGEHYDATREIPNWNLPEMDDSDWAYAVPAPEPRGEARLCEADPIVDTQERKPVKIVACDDGSFIYDFGINGAGVCRLCVRGERGQKIEFQHGEYLVDGKVDVANIWFAEKPQYSRDEKLVHKDIYICKGQGTECYTPSFTYHGFRYVTVTGITAEQATEDLLTYVVRNSDVRPCGGFETTHETVNKLQQMTVRADLSNFHYFPTDCPQREKNGWTADAALSAEQMLLNLTVSVSYREWLRNICKAQNDAGALPGIIPTAGWGFQWGNGPAWDCALVYLPYYSYIYRGDEQVVRECAPAFMRYLQYLITRNDEKGLIAIGLGDWCQVVTRQPKAPLVVTDTIVSMDIAQKMAFLFECLNMSAEMQFARSVAENYRNAFRKHLIDPDTAEVYGGFQTCQAMALHYGLFEPEEEKRAFSVLLDMIRAQNDFMDVGVLGAKVLFHVLTKFGYTDLALKLIVRPEFPSYGNWVAKGATTLWEDFVAEKRYSMNHHFWGDISAWFIKCLAGICYNPEGTDWKRVDIRPHFPTEMADAKAYFDSNFGRIEAGWQRTTEGISLSLTVPDGMNGTVTLEQGWLFENGEASRPAVSGEYRITKA